VELVRRGDNKSMHRQENNIKMDFRMINAELTCDGILDINYDDHNHLSGYFTTCKFLIANQGGSNGRYIHAWHIPSLDEGQGGMNL
jgi:hypothetical protein